MDDGLKTIIFFSIVLGASLIINFVSLFQLNKHFRRDCKVVLLRRKLDNFRLLSSRGYNFQHSTYVMEYTDSDVWEAPDGWEGYTSDALERIKIENKIKSFKLSTTPEELVKINEKPQPVQTTGVWKED